MPIVTVALVTVPLGFLIGLGGFDEWAYYASGRSTGPSRTRARGAPLAADYFRRTPTTR